LMTWAAWAGALIFALHPAAVYAVGYVVQRSTLMALFFVLIMQLAYIKALLGGRWGYLLLAAVAYFLAVFSKEHSFMAPALLAAETWLLRGQIRTGKRALWLVWIAFALTGALIVLRAKGVFGTPYEAMAADLFKQEGVGENSASLHLLSILTQMGLYFKYLLLWLLPNPAWMSIDMRVPFVSGLDAWQGWLGGAAFLAYGVIGLRLLWRGGGRGLLGLAMLYPWVQFILEFSTIRVQEPFVLYRSYLWMPGLLFALPAVLLAYPQLAEKMRGKLVLLGVVVLAGVLGGAAANRLWVMSTPYLLWNDAALLLPSETMAGADRIYFNRGQSEVAMGRLDDAIADFRRSIAVSPQYAPVHFELGWTLARLNHFGEAMAEFEKSIALDPKFPNAYFGKGMLLKMTGKPVEAKEQMEKACDLKVPMACLMLGRLVVNENK
jgi:tetratricopeptide (TPR) repeat protein